MLRSTAGSALKMHCEFTQGREETGETEEIAGKESFSSGWWSVWQHVEIGAHPGLQIEHFTMKNISPTFLCFFSSSTWHHGGSWTKIHKHTQRSASSKAATNLALMPGNRNCWAATWPLLMWNIVFFEILRICSALKSGCLHVWPWVVAESSEMMLWVRSLMLRYVICYVCKISTKHSSARVLFALGLFGGPCCLRIVSRINDNFVLWLVLVTLTAISFPETLGKKGCHFLWKWWCNLSALLVESSFISSFLFKSKM